MAIEAGGRAANERLGIPIPGIDPEIIKAQGLPGSDEIEITILGINENAGESIVLHIGNGDWIVIDCCKTREGVNLPKFYLESLGVGFENVIRVACTHLHSDHITGLSEVLSDCENARFAYPLIGDENTLRYILAQYNLDKGLPNDGTFGEFMKCVRVAKKEKKECIILNIDSPIFVDDTRHVMGVSPSRKMNEIYQYKLLKYKLGDPIPEQMLKTNFCSVATILNIGKVHAILGADLEANRQNKAPIRSCIGTCIRKSKRGWCNVFTASQYFPCYKYDYIKIPHHSSATGFCDSLWVNHMTSPVVGTSTVFLEGANALPTQDMIDEYSALCDELYYTSKSPLFKKDKVRGAKIDDKKGVAYDEMTAIPEQIGVITSRKPIDGGNWTTHCFYSAIREK